ncbi:heat-inducible transcriptional repressor HrcA [Galenea microaerophila]
MKPLNERKLMLFQNLMTLYLAEGRPIGSSHLAEVANLGVSSATIRNAMADLEKMGLLYSPHTSAGRVPTEAGLRFFVDTMLHIPSQDQQLEAGIEQQLKSIESQDEALNRAANLISDLTGLAGVVMLPNKAEERLEHIEFVRLNENRVLVVLLFTGQDIQNRVIELEKPVSASQLQEISNYLNRHFAGFTLKEVQQQIVQQMQQIQQHLNHAMQQMMRVTERVLNDQLNLTEPYIISGKTKLLNYRELGDAERLKALFEAFQEHSAVLNLLDKSLQQKGLQIFIGRECGAEAYADCSVVTSPYEIEGELMGVIGVVGPTRMPYAQVAARVMVTANTLSKILSKHA